jgi:hypothetical protein
VVNVDLSECFLCGFLGCFVRVVVRVLVGVVVRVLVVVLDVVLTDVPPVDEVGTTFGGCALPQPTSADAPSSAPSTTISLRRIATPRGPVRVDVQYRHPLSADSGSAAGGSAVGSCGAQTGRGHEASA